MTKTDQPKSAKIYQFPVKPKAVRSAPPTKTADGKEIIWDSNWYHAAAIAEGNGKS